MPEIEPLKSKKRMANVPSLPVQALPRLFLMPVNSELHQFLVEAHKIVSAGANATQNCRFESDSISEWRRFLR